MGGQKDHLRVQRKRQELQLWQARNGAQGLRQRYTKCEHICFSYNISSYEKAQAGERCEKGMHVCATKGCFGNHPHHSCNNKKKWQHQDEPGFASAMPTSKMHAESAELTSKAPQELDTSEVPTADKFAKEPAHPTGDIVFRPKASSSHIGNKAPDDLPTDSNLDDIGVFCIEICSGTAGLTASLRKVGFQNSFGVDHIVKSGCRAPVIKVDVSSSIDLAKSWIQRPNCAYTLWCFHVGLRAEHVKSSSPMDLCLFVQRQNLTAYLLWLVEIGNVLNLPILSMPQLVYLFYLHILNPTRSLFWLTSFWLEDTGGGSCACQLPQLHVGRCET